MIFDEIPDFTEHIFRSTRGWLHRLFPGVNIYITRKQAAAAESRPGFRLSMVAGPEITNEEGTAGMRWVSCSIQVHYQGTDVIDAQRVVGRIVANAETPARIPLFLYDAPYVRPPNLTVANPVGGSLPETVDIAVAIEDADGNRMDPSAPVTAKPGDRIIRVNCVQWPAGVRGAQFHIYANFEGGPLRYQGSVDGNSELPFFDLAAIDADGAAPPGQARYPIGGLRVNGMTTTIEEMGETEEHHDAMCVLRLYAQVPLNSRAQMVQELQP